MRKFMSLLKIQLSARYGFSSMRYSMKNDKKTLWKGIGLGIVILLSLLEVMGLYTFMMIQMYKTGESLGSPQIILTMASVGAGLFVLFFGIFYILGTLFLAKDSELLASLPVSQGSVFASKFMMVLIGEYPIAFLIMLPPVIVYGVSAHQGPLYYLLAILCTLFLPLIPLVLSAFLSLLLMNIVSRSRRRDLITTIGAIVLTILFVGGQNYLMSRMPSDDTDFMMALIQNSNEFVSFMGRAFPPSIWVTRILSSGGVESLVNLLYLLAGSGVAFALVYFMASFIYNRGATAQLETQFKPGKTKLSYKSSSQVLAIFRNEWRMILRTPIYALNSLVIVFMAPLLLMLPLFGGNFTSDPDIQFIFSLIQQADAQPQLLLIISGIISFFALINPAVASTFSREGKYFWILKNIPVKPEVQVLGKLLAGYSISLSAAVLAGVMAMFSLNLDPVLVLMIILLCALAMVPVSAVNLFVDLKHPKLSWNNPQEAIKQNFNVVLGMLLGLMMISVFGVIGYFLATLGLSLFALFGLMALVLVIASYLSFLLIKRSARRSYSKIEV